MPKTYDPKQVLVTINGLQISGFAEGTFISYERNKDTFTEKIGADGQVTRSKSNDKTGTLTLTLLQTSQSNDVLSALHLADEQANNGVSVLLIKENLPGGTTFLQGLSWVKKPATVERAQELSDVAWTITVEEQTPLFIGGIS